MGPKTNVSRVRSVDCLRSVYKDNKLDHLTSTELIRHVRRPARLVLTYGHLKSCARGDGDVYGGQLRNASFPRVPLPFAVPEGVHAVTWMYRPIGIAIEVGGAAG